MSETKRKVYIIGHKNPDTDSVVSAAAYAYLKQTQGMKDCFAARAGKITPQTEYIFNRFKVPIPEYLPDLVPKTAYYMGSEYSTADAGDSLWSAVKKMQEFNKVLPVVNKDGTYQSLLHYNAFAQNVLKIVNPKKDISITTSIHLIKETLNAQPLVLHNEEAISRSAILVAAGQFETFKRALDLHLPENVIVITGDRSDVLDYCIDKGIRAIVVTTGAILEKKLREKADKNKVSVLASPYGTSSTTMLIIYSTPVSSMADADVSPVQAIDTVRKIRPLLSNSPSRCLPVVNEQNQVIGLISESDLLHEANIEVIMVDHNEMSQAIEGIENYKILEIIDHHRLGSINTKYPITFINKPVGATCTIITNLYREYKIPLTREIASILLCGIIADTLTLQSATTTHIDRETAEYLSNVTNLDIEKLGMDIAQAASNIKGRSASDVIHQDMKEYTEEGYTFTVSQIEVDNPEDLVAHKEEFLAELEIERRTLKALFCSLMVTDITKLTSLLIVAAEPSFASMIGLPKQEDSVYVLRDVVSRKKQLIPLLSEQIEKLSG